MLTRRNTKQCHDRRDERDRSRHGHRPGYTLEDGSGCLTIGVHLKPPLTRYPSSTTLDCPITRRKTAYPRNIDVTSNLSPCIWTRAHARDGTRSGFESNSGARSRAFKLETSHNQPTGQKEPGLRLCRIRLYGGRLVTASGVPRRGLVLLVDFWVRLVRSEQPTRPSVACYGMDASRFPATMSGQTMEANVTFDLLAIDIGKQSLPPLDLLVLAERH